MTLQLVLLIVSIRFQDIIKSLEFLSGIVAKIILSVSSVYFYRKTSITRLTKRVDFTSSYFSCARFFFDQLILAVRPIDIV